MHVNLIKTYFSRLFILAISYAIIGKLSLLLAIPPGFASPVWPPSGVALGLILLWGYRYWPGILLGSMTINIWVSQEVYTNLIALANGVGIALGASLQAVVSKWLIERITAPPWKLEDSKQITAIVIIGGPICCVISAAIGNTVLLVNGVIPTDAWFPAWLTWWIGDSIGVMACTPILLALLAGSLSKARKLVVTTPLVAILITVIYLFFSAQRWEQEKINNQVIRTMEQSVEHIQDDLNSYMLSLFALAKFYQSSDFVSRKSFQQYTEDFVKRSPGIQALEWVPIVPEQKRASLTHSARAEGIENFNFLEYDPRSQHMITAKFRKTYYPVFYIEPLKANESALGYDLGSNPRRLKAIQKAMNSHQAVATEKIILVQSETPESAFLVFQSIIKEAVVKGFALGVFKVKPLIDKVKSQFKKLDVSLIMQDENYETLYQVGKINTQEQEGKSISTVFNLHRTVNIADRQWRIHFQFKPQINLEHRFWPIWSLIVGGFLIIGMLSYVLLIIIGQAEITEREVKRRTTELETSKRTLGEQTNALEKSNQALEDFAYIASHDLKEPLRGVSNYCHFIIEDYQDKLDQRGTEMLENISTLTKKMESFINDLLKYSRLGHMEDEIVETDVGKVLNEIIGNLKHITKQPHVNIIVEQSLPTIYCNKVKIMEVFSNLIINAIKYNDNDNIKITIGCDINQPSPVFFVRDNGIGIPEHFQSKIFKIFQRLHTEEEYGGGAGAGLSIVKKIVELYQGTIWVKSQPNRGSTFYFTLPAVFDISRERECYKLS